MRSVMMTGLLLLTMASTAAYADDAAPKAKAAPAKTTKATKSTKAKPAAMSEEKRRDLERRIEALERKNEMQYRETTSPNGAPGAAPADAPGAKPAAH